MNSAETVGIMVLSFFLGVFVDHLVFREARRVGEKMAFLEGRDTAIANAAMKAYDMGHPEVHREINALVERGK